MTPAARGYGGRKAPDDRVDQLFFGAANLPGHLLRVEPHGRMVWSVPREMLAPSADLGRLRNIGMGLLTTELRMCTLARLITRSRYATSEHK